MPFDLTQLGWKGFQDLCAAVAAEVLDRPVQTFLPGHDGGRDAAFLGTWLSAPSGQVKSTIQCKFTVKLNARLSLAKLRPELKKVAELAASGLAEDYVVMTNAGVTGTSDEAICKAFVDAGAKHCQVFDGDWILRQVRERPRLRMMAPRVYGLISLSELITGPVYDQARSILAEMGGDLGAFVPTKAHQAAVEALARHGFVLLVGDPASGKSTIAATLALGGLDDGCGGAVRISSPDQLELWRPDERQFLWVDDAFGPTQYEPARVQRWNAELPRLRAAVRDGARVVFTTRNYIWERARKQLKLGAFALLEESEIVVDVQALTQPERARILYNHVRTGGQPLEVRRKLKPHLGRLSHNPNLTPEIARRLGDPYITARLPVRRQALNRFVDEPVAFLREVIEQLSDAGRAALALIFMHPSSGLPSPIAQSEALETVSRLSGCDAAEIARELEAMNGSLTLLVPGAHNDRWVFRHPTIADAFADIVAGSPEQVELYVAGARLERLMVEVVCGPDKPGGAKVRVPAALYPALLRRLAHAKLDYSLKAFLATRCEAAFLEAFVAARPDVLDLAGKIHSLLDDNPDVPVLAALHRAGYLPEDRRRVAVGRIDEFTVEQFDVGVFTNADIRSLLTDEEFEDISDRFKAEWIDDLGWTFRHWRDDYSSSDMLGMAVSFKDALQSIEGEFCTPENAREFVAIHDKLDEWIGELEEAEPIPKRSTTGTSATDAVDDTTDDIFDDIDT
jgi:hypothetical protein